MSRKQSLITFLRMKKASEELGEDWEIKVCFRDGMRYYEMYYKNELRHSYLYNKDFLKRLRYIIYDRNYRAKKREK